MILNTSSFGVVEIEEDKIEIEDNIDIKYINLILNQRAERFWKRPMP